MTAEPTNQTSKMKTSSFTKSLLLLALLSGAFAVAPLALAEGHDHASMAQPAAPADQAAWLAKARTDYPLDACVVSGDKLEANAMGGPVDYIHQETGKPDRLVRFCCKDCVRDFKKNPAKYLTKIDDAAAAKAGHSGRLP
jgi:hypothetical protein